MTLSSLIVQLSGENRVNPFGLGQIAKSVDGPESIYLCQKPVQYFSTYNGAKKTLI
jgi:hypothetical protein